jgi:hypothetical protein
VTLHEEHAEVLRKAISDPKYIGEIDWADGTIEVIETAEHAIANKTQARCRNHAQIPRIYLIIGHVSHKSHNKGSRQTPLRYATENGLKVIRHSR